MNPHERLRGLIKEAIASLVPENNVTLIKDLRAAVDALPVSPTVEQRIAAVMENKAITALLPVTAVPQAGADVADECKVLLDKALALQDKTHALLLETEGERKSYLAQLTASQARVEALEAAMRAIVDSVPACSEGGGFHWEHHDQDGNYAGSVNVDPMMVVQGMQNIAQQALAGAGGA